MDSSVLIARLMGPVMLVVGASMWLNGDGYRAMAKEFIKSNALIFIAGLIALSLGVTLVVVHNVWVGDWPVIITLFGWLAVVSGALRLTWPAKLRELASGILERKQLFIAAGAFYAVLGAVLTYFGFMA